MRVNALVKQDYAEQVRAAELAGENAALELDVVRPRCPSCGKRFSHPRQRFCGYRACSPTFVDPGVPAQMEELPQGRGETPQEWRVLALVEEQRRDDRNEVSSISLDAPVSSYDEAWTLAHDLGLTA